MFSTLWRTEIIIWATFNLSSASALNLILSKTLSLGRVKSLLLKEHLRMFVFKAAFGWSLTHFILILWNYYHFLFFMSNVSHCGCRSAQMTMNGKCIPCLVALQAVVVAVSVCRWGHIPWVFLFLTRNILVMSLWLSSWAIFNHSTQLLLAFDLLIGTDSEWIADNLRLVKSMPLFI